MMTQEAVIAMLKGERLVLLTRLRQVDEALNEMRVKCPNCRCMLLPDEKCTCCESAEITDKWLKD